MCCHVADQRRRRAAQVDADQAGPGGAVNVGPSLVADHEGLRLRGPQPGAGGAEDGGVGLGRAQLFGGQDGPALHQGADRVELVPLLRLVPVGEVGDGAGAAGVGASPVATGVGPLPGAQARQEVGHVVVGPPQAAVDGAVGGHVGVGLGVGDVGAAGDEVADPGAQLFVEVEFAVLVAGEVLPVEGLPALGGLGLGSLAGVYAGVKTSHKIGKKAQKRWMIALISTILCITVRKFLTVV